MKNIQNKSKIGVVGCGVVGGIILKGYQALGFDVVGYDKFKDEYKNNFPKVMETDISFLCLPTVAGDTGEMNLSPFDETFKMMDKYKGLIVIKSTVIPGTTDKYQSQYPHLKVVHSPEFLTERRAMFDFFQPHKILLGFPDKYFPNNDLEDITNDSVVDEFSEMYDQFEEIHSPFEIPVSMGNAKTTEFMKFMSNCYFATKVVFANEMNEIAKVYGANYNEAKEFLYLDPRVGKDHLSINSQRRYGGMCLPKDVNQLLEDLVRKNLIPEVLTKVKEVNERDEKLIYKV